MNLNATIVLEVVSFLFLLFLLSRILWVPLMHYLDNRTAFIDTMLKDAEDRLRQAELLKQNIERQKERIDREALYIKQRADKEAEDLRRRLLEQAKEEAREMVNKAEKEIEHKVEQERGALRSEIVEIAIISAEQILRRELRGMPNRDIIEKDILELADAKRR